MTPEEVAQFREQYEARKAADKRREEERKAKRWWWFGQRDPITRYTKWLSYFTFALVVATVVNAGVLWKTDFTLRNTLDRTQRAWIAPLSARIIALPHMGPIGVQVNYANVGKEPAIQMKHAARMDDTQAPTQWDEWEHLTTKENTSCEDLSAGDEGVSVYPTPTDEPRILFERGTMPSQDTEVSAIEQRKKIFYINGCFGYLIGVTGPYSRYCFYLDPQPGRQVKDWNFKSCPKGNDAN